MEGKYHKSYIIAHEEAIYMRIGNFNVEIEFIADNIVRVLYYYGREAVIDNSLVVLPNLEKLSIKGESTSPSIISLSSKSLSVEINTSNGELIIKDNKGGIVVKEKRRDLKFNEELSTYNVEQEFELSEGERLYGLGQHAGGNGLGQSSAYKLDYNGLSITLSQRNTDIGIPFMISSKGSFSIR